jgi:hypothetical protein
LNGSAPEAWCTSAARTKFVHPRFESRSAPKRDSWYQYPQEQLNSGMEMLEALQVNLALWGMIICTVLSAVERLG